MAAKSAQPWLSHRRRNRCRCAQTDWAIVRGTVPDGWADHALRSRRQEIPRADDECERDRKRDHDDNGCLLFRFATPSRFFGGGRGPHVPRLRRYTGTDCAGVAHNHAGPSRTGSPGTPAEGRLQRYFSGAPRFRRPAIRRARCSSRVRAGCDRRRADLPADHLGSWRRALVARSRREPSA